MAQQTQLALNRQTWPDGLFPTEGREQARARRPQAPSLMNAISMMTNNLTYSLFGGRGSQACDERPGSLMGASSVVRGNNPSSDGRPDSSQSSSGGGGGGALGHVQEVFTWLSPSVLLAAQKGHQFLFNGLRVRMGIATGTLPPGSGCKSSAVMDLAKMVSDMASGGQIMMDEATFKSIKERMEEFGAVDHNGMNFKQLNSIKPPWYSCLKRKHLRNPDDALLLDMGEYTYCPGSKRMPLFQLDGTPVACDTPGTAGTQQPPATPKCRGKGYEPVRVYQILPPALVARAKVLGNKVALKDEWYCSDSPYFAAPGTLEAPLGPVEGPLELPQITMAFAIMEGGKAFAARHRRDVRRVNDVAAACIQACLRLVPGGYLCRLQDGDLKYMVAFATPEAAMEWALLLQDVIMYVDWPESALKHWKEESDSRGRLIFRGPRMKIGLCEGSPRSIIPDHIGRADYHGASVNQAARFMDAAAHGGMVALQESFAIKVIAKWRERAAAAEVAAATTTTTTTTIASTNTSTAVTTKNGVAAEAALSDGRMGVARSVFATPEVSALLSAAVASSGSSSAAHRAGRAVGLTSGGPYDGSEVDHTSGSVPSMSRSPSRCSSRRARMAAVQEVGQEAEAADGAQELSLPDVAHESRSGASPPSRGDVRAEPSSVRPSVAVTVGVRGGGSRGLVKSAVAATSTTIATEGPVAEAAESDGADTASDPSSSAAAVTASAVGNGGAGGGKLLVARKSLAAALGTVPAYSTSGVESGPSMTSLASTSAAGLGTASSTAMAPPTLMPYGSSDVESSSPAADLNLTPALQQLPAELQPRDSAPSALPLRLLTGADASAAASAAIHTTLRSGGGTPTNHVSFVQERTPGLSSHHYPTSSLEPSGSPSSAGFYPRRVASAVAGAGTISTVAGGRHPSLARIASDSIPVSTCIAVNAIPPLDAPPSSIRSPRPPSLMPLSLPSEQERDEALRVERELADAAKKVHVDGPVDARYPTHVLAFRIGSFRFKGSPEPIPMAHVILEHLAERRFSSEGPKGKGAKVGAASGLLDECDTSLPDLASLLRERYMLLPGHGGRHGSGGSGGGGLFGNAHSAFLDINSSSPSNRRLHATLVSRSMGASPNSARRSATVEAAAAALAAGSGSNTPSPKRMHGSGAITLWKSRSVAARVGGGGGGGGSSSAPSRSDGGGASPKVPRVSTLVSHWASFASSSMRCAVGISGGGGVPIRRDGATAVPGAATGGEVTGQQLELPTAAAAARRHSASSADGSTTAAIVTSADQPAGLVGLTLTADVARDDSMSVSPLQGASHKDAWEFGSQQGKGNASGSGSGSGGGGGSSINDPRVCRPSPLRYMSGRDGAVPERHLETANTAAAAAVAAARVAPPPTCNADILASGDERV